METDNELNSLALANNVYNAFFAETANSSTPSDKPPLPPYCKCESCAIEVLPSSPRIVVLQQTGICRKYLRNLKGCFPLCWIPLHSNLLIPCQWTQNVNSNSFLNQCFNFDWIKSSFLSFQFVCWQALSHYYSNSSSNIFWISLQHNIFGCTSASNK